eukprot:scaffold45815_cov21-Tisochrysis_lutea.AAC.1
MLVGAAIGFQKPRGKRKEKLRKPGLVARNKESKAPLKQRSNGVVVGLDSDPHPVDGVQAMGANLTDGVSKLGSCCLSVGYRIRVKMGCSPSDGAHKDSTWKASVSSKGANTVGKCPLNNMSSSCFKGLLCHVLAAFLYTKHPWQKRKGNVYLLRVSKQRLGTVL